ncbi:MAG: hypothetical protein KJN87_04375 [Desulfofustis sp.]|nr:hypothetical protein [Desulfofustis sp.]
MRIPDAASIRREATMAGAAREKKSSYLLYFLVLVLLLWFTPSLFALPSPTRDVLLHNSELHTHFHQETTPEPLHKPVEVKQKESLRLDVTGASLSCTEDDCSHHRGCNLEIAYRLSAKIQQDLDVGTQVVCEAVLDYTTSHGYHLKSERCSSPATHILHHQDRIDSTLVVEFQFSPYEQVIDAEVGAIRCHLNKTEIILGSAN